MLAVLKTKQYHVSLNTNTKLDKVAGKYTKFYFFCIFLFLGYNGYFGAVKINCGHSAVCR